MSYDTPHVVPPYRSMLLAEGVGRFMSGPSHISKTVPSTVHSGPLEEDRTAHKHRGVKDHTSPNHIAKRKFLPSLRSDIHDTGIASPRCVDRLPSHISKMVVSTVSGGGGGVQRSPAWSPVSRGLEEADMTSTNGIRVMLVDDHPIMRRGLQQVPEDSEGFEIVGQAADGVEAVGMAKESRPDVIVMDVMMPKMDGVEACRDILDLLPDTKVVMLTASTEEDAAIEAIAAGATGFVQKYSGSEDLVNVLRKVADGRLMVPDDAVRRVFKLLRSGAHLTPGPKVLTVREWEVLRHFAQGKSYARIGEALGVGTTTIRNAVYRIQDKLGVDSKQEVVVWAVRNGLLDGEEGQEAGHQES